MFPASLLYVMCNWKLCHEEHPKKEGKKKNTVQILNLDGCQFIGCYGEYSKKYFAVGYSVTLIS